MSFWKRDEEKRHLKLDTSVDIICWWLLAKNKPDRTFSAASNLLIVSLSTSLLKLTSPPCWWTHNLPACCLFSDHGVDWSRVWEQRARQLWRGRQLPEVPPYVLRPQPSVPPHWRGLGLGLQSRPKGECVLLSSLASRGFTFSLGLLGTIVPNQWWWETDLYFYS